ncbi:MAG: hypothetical protein COZ43_08165 [Sphingomonadales bacterium CG_4_10_14_3_um_filter_58_15]|nr:MAG: hypothetical protein COZ43_08165 [Sphingomonadales bacterium CG_4_10_14_3_um_filter_58_15]
MADYDPEMHICDDWISITMPDRETILAAQVAFTACNHWTEIVPGLNSIAVQFDPVEMSPDEAATIVRDQLGGAALASEPSPIMTTIPVCYHKELAPDLDYAASKLGIKADALPSWHQSHTQTVAMLGFMPGFAYLESPEPCPTIGRLAKPRQLVKAGSIGIIGQQSCVYSFDSPGGWPIIGRTPLRLFDPEKAEPALLSAGQAVRFESISREEFESWPRADEE